MKIFFLTPYPVNESPSQRFRFEQYFHILTIHDHSYRIQSFLDSNTWRLFFQPGNSFTKLVALLRGFIRRIMILPRLRRYDFIFIHREAAPIGPPILEWVISRILKCRIVYDFDDAIWLTDRLHEPWWLRLLKWRSKVGMICRWSYKVSCGNTFLADYARKFNKHVIFNPSTIDTEALHNRSKYPAQSNNDFVIGWTGSHSTLKYLRTLESTLQEIEDEYQHVKVMVIADRPPDLKLKSLLFKPWNIKTEIEDLLNFSIGIMPLPDDEWSKGKCGFKALQYMALEIPAVVSPVGANLEIIEDGKSGLFASTEKEWKEKIIQLIEAPDLAKRIGKNGKQRVLEHYSVHSNASWFLSLFE